MWRVDFLFSSDLGCGDRFHFKMFWSVYHCIICGWRLFSDRLVTHLKSLPLANPEEIWYNFPWNKDGRARCLWPELFYEDVTQCQPNNASWWHQQEHHHIQHYTMDEHFRYGLSWPSGQEPLNRAYIHPNSKCSTVLPEQEDKVYSSYEVDGYKASALLSSHWHYLPKNCVLMQNPSNHVSSWIVFLNPRKYRTHITMQETTTISWIRTKEWWLL